MSTAPDQSDEKTAAATGPSTTIPPVTSATIPSIPPAEWPDNPLFICVNPKCEYITTNQPHLPADEQNSPIIRVNEVFEFESRSFKGKAIIRIPDLPNSQNWYFEGRRRKMDITVQGQFKRTINATKVATGQAFDGAFRAFPGKYLVSSALSFVRRLSPALRADVEGDRPHLISTLAQASQVINVARPGDEPQLPEEPPEDMTLLGPEYEGLSSQERKSLLSQPEEVQKLTFAPGLVWTFSFYSHMISPLSYHFYIIGMKFGVQKYLPSPFQLMALIEEDDEDPTAGLALSNSDDEDDEPEPETHAPSRHALDKADYLWNFVVWHTKLVAELSGEGTGDEEATAEPEPAEKEESGSWWIWGS